MLSVRFTISDQRAGALQVRSGLSMQTTRNCFVKRKCSDEQTLPLFRLHSKHDNTTFPRLWPIRLSMRSNVHCFGSLHEYAVLTVSKQYVHFPEVSAKSCKTSFFFTKNVVLYISCFLSCCLYPESFLLISISVFMFILKQLTI